MNSDHTTTTTTTSTSSSPTTLPTIEEDSFTVSTHSSPRNKAKVVEEEFRCEEEKKDENSKDDFLDFILDSNSNSAYDNTKKQSGLSAAAADLADHSMKRQEETGFSYEHKEEESKKFGNRLLREAKKLAAAEGGSCCDQPCDDEQSRLAMRCILNHKFKLSVEELRARKWCVKCVARLERYRDHLGQDGSRILNAKMSKVLKIECSLGHRYESDIRRIFRKVCPDCRKMFRAQQKAKLLEEAKYRQVEHERK